MSVRLELWKDALAIAAENYKENARILAAFDDKAQKMGTIAGLFLGALFALIRPDTIASLRKAIGLNAISILTAATLLFITCIVLCLIEMWVFKLPLPLSLRDVTSLIGNLLRLPETSLNEDVQERYCNEKIHVWTWCIDAQNSVALRKWKLVFAAQLALGLAIVILGFLLLLIYFGHVSAVTPLKAP